MVNRGWLYGLMIFLAQTCNPYYSANDSRNQYEEEIVFEDQEIEENEVIEIPLDALEIEEDVRVERPPSRVNEAPPPPPPPPAPEKEKPYQVVEEMPRFSGCENQGFSKDDKKRCADGKMLEFIYNNIKYPEVAKANGIEGRVIMRFVVEKDGSLGDVQVLRDPGGGCGKEAERVVKMMPKWIAGKQRGRTVKVWFTLPVVFKLPKETALDEEPMFAPMPEPVEPEQEAIFKVVEDMPRFPGCENKGLNKTEVRKCADAEVLKFVYGNLKYPKIARENGVEGRAILQWVVNPDGTISDIKVLRDPGGGCGEEAVRVIKLMPKWIPGKQRGRPVPVRYTFPVQFKLEKKGK